MFKVFLLPAVVWGLFLAPALALAPLEGLLKGDARDIDSYDPLSKMLSQKYGRELGEGGQREKLERYKGLFFQSANLKNACDVERYYTYENQWKEESARRSVAATLQYLGLDLASRAVAEYAKSFKVSKDEYENIVNNLVVNTCSENISVFSKKLLRDNLLQMYREKSGFKPPSHKGSPFVSEENFKISESYQSKRREFEFALKNFRDFCSWDAGVDNYRMLAPYLRNPFVMSLVFNHLLEREIVFDDKEQAAALRPSKNTALVACEDLVCRRRDSESFRALFPRMVGSSELEDDLTTLYCEHFRDVGMKTKEAPKKIQEWINGQGIEEGLLLPMSFVALSSGVPDFFFSAETFNQLLELHSAAIDKGWDAWAQNQTDTLVLDLLYEESLFVDLEPVSPRAKAQGDLSLTFDFSLGELDRELKEIDKIGFSTSLVFPKSYLAWIRRDHIAAANKSDYKKLDEIEARFAKEIDRQLEVKKKHFSIALWNKSFGTIMAKELVKRLVSYKGNRYDKLDHKEVVAPVKFRFGLFALKYLRDKYKAKYHGKP